MEGFRGVSESAPIDWRNELSESGKNLLKEHEHDPHVQKMTSLLDVIFETLREEKVDTEKLKENARAGISVLTEEGIYKKEMLDILARETTLLPVAIQWAKERGIITESEQSQLKGFAATVK